MGDLESDEEVEIPIKEEEQDNITTTNLTGHSSYHNENKRSKTTSLKTEDVEIKQEDQDEARHEPSAEDAQTALELAQSIEMHGIPIKRLAHVMQSVEPIVAKIRQRQVYSSEETYELLMEANKYSVEIDNELVLVHRFIQENYSQRFHELGSLILNPVAYAKTVRIIGNDLERIRRSDPEILGQLREFLGGPTTMTISMAVLNNQGQALGSNELFQVMEACTLVETLDKAKADITAFVSERLASFAPNLVQIVNSHTAAQLLAVAGGLDKLAATPSANIAALGSNKSMGLGFGYSTLRRHGYLYYSDIIQQTPIDKRKQAMRIVSAKIVLAARVDSISQRGQPSLNGVSSSSSSIDSAGKKWRAEIQEKIDKLSEPPQVTKTKALKIPDDGPSKKRGGRRIRKMKEQWMQTELMKARNRLEFGKPEQEVGVLDQTLGLGMAQTKGIRKIAVDNRTRAKMSKGMHNRLENINKTTRQMESSGLATSLAYTRMQGALELADPGRISKQALEETSKSGWFANKKVEETSQQKNIGN